MNGDNKCLGLELTKAIGTDADYIPMEAFVITKGIENGEIKHRIYCTPELGGVDGLGMLTWAEIIMKTGLTSSEPENQDEE